MERVKNINEIKIKINNPFYIDQLNAINKLNMKLTDGHKSSSLIPFEVIIVLYYFNYIETIYFPFENLDSD